ncbi:MAG: cell wall surface anchored protein [Parcubacteria group bacterium Gr01-1014_30]|nr:MAG: cell wall surface anchored protein [Parcubacteria group bacterium Gr01-1014_30]
MPEDFISLQAATQFCNYTQEYLSLRARQGKLKAVKFGRNWVTRKEWLREYLAKVDEYNNNHRNGNGVLKIVEPPKELEKVLAKDELFSSNLAGSGDLPRLAISDFPSENLGKILLPSLRFGLRPVVKLVSTTGFVAALTLVLLAGGVVLDKESLKNVYTDIYADIANFVQPVASLSPLLEELPENFDRGVVILVQNLFSESEHAFSAAFEEIQISLDYAAGKLQQAAASSKARLSQGSHTYILGAQVAQYTIDTFKEFNRWLGQTSDNLTDYAIHLLASLGKIGLLAQLTPAPAGETPTEEIFLPLSLEPYLTINAPTEITAPLSVQEQITLLQNEFEAVLALSELSANQTYTFPSQSGIVCLTTGNCDGLGGGVSSTGGEPNRLAKFVSSGEIGESSIQDLYIGAGTALTIDSKGRVQATDDLCTDLIGGRCLSTLPLGGAPSGGGTVTNITNESTGLATTSPWTVGFVPYATSTTALTNSIISQLSGNIGISSSTPNALLSIGNNAYIDSSGNVVGTWQGTAVAAAFGGTGFTSYSRGDILFATTTTAFYRLATGTEGQVLKITSGIPAWGIDSGGGAIGTSSPFTVGFLPYATSTTSVTDSVIFQSAGQIGIGTTSPASLLELYSASANSQLTVSAATATSTNPLLTFRTGASSPSTRFILGVDNNDSQKFKIATSSAFTSTSTVLTIDPATGYVGIGTSTPNAKLTVHGNSFPGSDLAYDLGASTQRWRNLYVGTTTIGSTITINSNTIEGSATTTLLTTGNSNQLVLGTNGNVGIGTTSPASLLEVYSTSTAQLTISAATATSTNPLLTFRTGESAPSSRFILGVDNNDSQKFKIATSSAFTSTSTVLTIDPATGNVGIGTTTPNAKLTLQGNFFSGSDLLYDLGASTQRWRNIYVGTTTIGSTVTIGSSDINFSGASTFTLASAVNALNIGSGTLSIDSSNNRVGLGTTSPASLLEVYSTSTAQLTVSAATATSTNPLLTFRTGASSPSTRFILGVDNNDSQKFKIATSSAFTSTSTVFTIDPATGNVGIGTTSPDNKLEIVGGGITLPNNNSNSFKFRTAGGAAKSMIFAGGDNTMIFGDWDSAWGNMRLITKRTQGIGINTSAPVSGGGITIGPDPATIAAGRTLLTVTTPADTINSSNEATDINFNLSATTTWPVGNLSLIRAMRIQAPTYAFQSGTSTITDAVTLSISGAPQAGANAFAFITNSHALNIASRNVNASTTNSYGLTVNAQTGATNNYAAAFLDGNVGIGTTSPASLLEVYSTSTAQLTVSAATATSTNPLLTFRTGASSPSTRFILGVDNNDSDKFKIATSSAFTSTSTVFTIDPATGNVGIGTTSPATLLTVATSTNIFNVLANGAVRFPSLRSPTDDRAVCGVSSDGEILFKNAACTTSSKRYKENIETLSYGLEELMQLNPVFFNYINGDNEGRTERRIGLIAEDVDLIIPEVVFTKDGLPDSIDYPNLVALNIKAIQELNLKIEDLINVTASSSPDSFAARFFSALFDRIKSWLADAANGIAQIFTNKLVAKELCVEDVCVTREQFLKIIESSGTGPVYTTDGGQSGGAEDSSPPAEEPTETATTTDTTATTTTATTTEASAEPEQEPEPEPEPAPEPDF